MFRVIDFRTTSIHEIGNDPRQASVDSPQIDRVFLDSGNAFTQKERTAAEIKRVYSWLANYPRKISVFFAFTPDISIFHATQKAARYPGGLLKEEVRS